MRIRPMAHGDATAVEAITADAFHDLDVATRRVDWPAPERRPPDRAAPWVRRLRHLIDLDGPGCWVVEDDEVGGVVGAAAAFVREGMLGLSTFAVRPGAQARGLGRGLLEAALGCAKPDAPAMICSSHDPRAIRLYRLAGFDVHPTMLMSGRVRRAAIPADIQVRDGAADDIELLDLIDRASRGHGHGVDHELLVKQYELLIVEHGHARAYAYRHPGGGPYLLAGTHPGAATEVLWAALAAPADVDVGFHNVSAAQSWAIDVGLAAGLELHSRGYLALRGMDPPAPYIPSGHFL